MTQTLTIGSKEGELITLTILKSKNRTDGFWNIDNNIILLGYERWEEFQDMWGQSERQVKFIQELTKISSQKIG